MGRKKQYQLDDQLRRAVEGNNFAWASELLAQGASPKTDKPGEKQLLALVEDEAMARLLVEAGADPCAVDHVGHRPGEGMKHIVKGLGPVFAGWFPGKEAAADYLEVEAMSLMAKAKLQASSPPVQMSDEESQAIKLRKIRI